MISIEKIRYRRDDSQKMTDAERIRAKMTDPIKKVIWCDFCKTMGHYPSDLS